MAAPEYATPAEVMARLRMPAGAPDADYVALCTDAANEAVDVYLARTGDPADPDAPYPPLVAPFPAGVRRAAIGAAMRIYRFRDTEANIDEAWGPEGVAVSLPRDPLAGYVDLLAPHRAGPAWSPA